MKIKKNVKLKKKFRKNENSKKWNFQKNENCKKYIKTYWKRTLVEYQSAVDD